MMNTENKAHPQQELMSRDRREMVKKLGKFAAYAAPFAILAQTNKAEAASGGGPRSTPRRR